MITEQEEKDFIQFHSGYFGEAVNDLKQISKICFSGEELIDYLRAHKAHLKSEPE